MSSVHTSLLLRLPSDIIHRIVNSIISGWLRLQSWLMPQSPHRLQNDLKCVEWDVKTLLNPIQSIISTGKHHVSCTSYKWTGERAVQCVHPANCSSDFIKQQHCRSHSNAGGGKGGVHDDPSSIFSHGLSVIWHAAAHVSRDTEMRPLQPQLMTSLPTSPLHRLQHIFHHFRHHTETNNQIERSTRHKTVLLYTLRLTSTYASWLYSHHHWLVVHVRSERLYAPFSKIKIIRN